VFFSDLATPKMIGGAPGKGQQEFLDLIGASPQVVGVFSGHTHRNFVSYAPASGRRVPYLENGAAKEYPGGYGIVSVYEGGWMRTFHRLRTCEFCREWIETTRGEFFGLYPLYTLGPLSARAFTHLYDCDAFTPPPSLPGNEALLSAPASTPPTCAQSAQAGPATPAPTEPAPAAPAAPAQQEEGDAGDDEADTSDADDAPAPVADAGADEAVSGGAANDGSLPFTGLTLVLPAAAGGALLAGGLALRRRGRRAGA